jgi:predicted hydrocarbon binding protein
MHGVVMRGFKSFVVETHGQSAWREIRSQASLDGMVFVPVAVYDDADATALLEAAASVLGTDGATLQRSFGRHLASTLVETYDVHVDGDWTALELVANVEEHIHAALRAKSLQTYAPPELSAEWVSDGRIEVHYGSERGLCDLAEGLIEGVGDHFGDHLSVEEVACMDEGADSCEFVVTEGEA